MGLFKQEEFRAERGNPFLYKNGDCWLVYRLSDRKVIANGLSRRWAQRIAGALNKQTLWIPMPDVPVGEWEG